MSNTPLEIERKYLIAYPDLSLLARRSDVTVSEITQTYLVSPDGEERRVRCRREGEHVTCYYTVKRRITDVIREEREEVITQAAYEDYLTEADPERSPLHKTRYCLPWGDLHVEIDIYPFWDDRAIAEVELPSKDTPVTLPPELTVIREVTGEVAYKNAALAKQNL